MIKGAREQTPTFKMIERHYLSNSRGETGRLGGFYVSNVQLQMRLHFASGSSRSHLASLACSVGYAYRLLDGIL